MANNKTDRILTGIFVCVMFLFVIFMLWYVPNHSERVFQIQDVEKSVETSHGREKKQQYEYNEAMAELPVVRSELEEIQPLADAAAQTVLDLKEERKELRQEKERLEASRISQTNADTATYSGAYADTGTEGSEGSDE